MSISDKIIQLNQVKQDIKQAIENKGVAMSGVPFTNYPLKINEISGGGGGSGDITFAELPLACEARATYDKNGDLAVFQNAWNEYKTKNDVLYEFPITRVAQGVEMGGFSMDIFDGGVPLQNLYNDIISDNLQLERNYGVEVEGDRGYLAGYYPYVGDISGEVDMPMPVYSFGRLNNAFALTMIADLTPLGMGVGLSLIKFSVFTNGLDQFKITKGVDIVNNGLIYSSVDTSYLSSAYLSSSVVDKSVVIPEGTQVIRAMAFENWTNYTLPFILPSTIERLVGGAFLNCSSVEYFELKSLVPPELMWEDTTNNPFYGTTCPIYVPDASYDAYVSDQYWSSLYGSRIKRVSEKV